MLERPLIFTGFMGSGKSSVGKIVAQRLGCRFVDLDAEIVAATGCSINEIFSSQGEQMFRALESAQLERMLVAGDNTVISTGGGVVLDANNRTLMRCRGVVINLKVTLDQVLARLDGCCDRPLLACEDAASRAETLMNAREQFYADADIRIDTDGKSVEDVASEVIRCIEGLSCEYIDRKSC